MNKKSFFSYFKTQVWQTHKRMLFQSINKYNMVCQFKYQLNTTLQKTNTYCY